MITIFFGGGGGGGFSRTNLLRFSRRKFGGNVNRQIRRRFSLEFVLTHKVSYKHPRSQG